MNERDLDARDRKYKKSVVFLKDLPASKLERLNYGLVKIIADKSDHIVGASVVAPHAELIAEEFAIAIRHRLTTLELASTPHVANSFNIAVKLAAKKLIKK
ncbi:hypothetical protein IKE83_02815 [Candidatus Saccharibacteria bacterium]|nr:hypothetical protein [Candidatus Saccharibacteria bacterium]